MNILENVNYQCFILGWLIFFLSSLLVLKFEKLSLDTTVSSLIAKNKITRVVFLISMVFSSILIFIGESSIEHIFPFNIFHAIGLFGIGLFPFTSGLSKKIHSIFALTFMISQLLNSILNVFYGHTYFLIYLGVTLILLIINLIYKFKFLIILEVITVFLYPVFMLFIF